MNQTGKYDDESKDFNREGNEIIEETGGYHYDCSSIAADSFPENADSQEDVSGQNVESGAEEQAAVPEKKESKESGAIEKSTVPEKKESGAEEHAIASEMTESLGDMMQVKTPTLDLLEGIAKLPAGLLMHPLALNIALRVLLPTMTLPTILLYAGTMGASYVAASFVDAIREILKGNSESRIKSELSDCFLKDGLNIHSFNKGGHIPPYLLTNLHLTEGFDGAVSGDLISLHYRDYSIVCCNIALTMSPVEGFEDTFTRDDVEARKYFKIADDQNVLFYGSVFMFFPGPAIEGNVRLTAQTPVQYLKDLQQMELGELVTGQEHLQQRMDFFHRYHEIEEENPEKESSGTENSGKENSGKENFGKENPEKESSEKEGSGKEGFGKENSGKLPEKEQVFTERVKDMVLQLEWETRAPVAVYAEKNIVCLAVQGKVYDFECIHDLDKSGDEIKNVLYTKIDSFKKILDTIIGPEGDEYTELLGSPADQRKSVYAPFLNPFHEAVNPEDEDIEAYVDDLAEWSADIYRFILHYSPVYQAACRSLGFVGRQFLSEFLLPQDAAEAKIWVKSSAGKQMRYSLTSAATNYFRDLWSASGKCEVRNIRKGLKVGNPIISFDIVLNPPIRKWNYSPEINHRLVFMCDPSHYSLNQLNDKKTQDEVVGRFAEHLKTVNNLSYDKDHTYQAVMELQEGHKYAMKPEEISKFCKWYNDCMSENMIKDGQRLKLQEDEEPSEQ